MQPDDSQCTQITPLGLGCRLGDTHSEQGLIVRKKRKGKERRKKREEKGATLYVIRNLLRECTEETDENVDWKKEEAIYMMRVYRVPGHLTHCLPELDSALSFPDLPSPNRLYMDSAPCQMMPRESLGLSILERFSGTAGFYRGTARVHAMDDREPRWMVLSLVE